MPRLSALDPHTADTHAKPLLDAVQKSLGATPNLFRTLAHSPAALEGYLSFSGSLGKGKLGRRIGAQIALATAEANGCNYCAAAHTALGKGAGLTDIEIDAARDARADDARAAAALRFAHSVIETRGHISDAELAAAHAAGLSEGEIGEVVAHVALNVFTNYFNSVAHTEIDFPTVRVARVPAGARSHPANAA